MSFPSYGWCAGYAARRFLLAVLFRPTGRPDCQPWCGCPFPRPAADTWSWQGDNRECSPNGGHPAATDVVALTDELLHFPYVVLLAVGQNLLEQVLGGL